MSLSKPRAHRARIQIYMPPNAPPSTVVENIRSVAEMQKHLEQERCFTDRVADLIGGFFGSMSFVLLHLCFFSPGSSSTPSLWASATSIPTPSSCWP